MIKRNENTRKRYKIKLHKKRIPRQTNMFPDMPRVSDNSLLKMKTEYLARRLKLILRDLDNWDIPSDLLERLNQDVYDFTVSIERLIYAPEIQTIR